MVQILPRTQATFGEKFSQGLEKGTSAGSQFAEMALQSALQQKAKKAELAQKLAAVDRFKNSPGYENLSDVQKFALEQEIAGLISGGSSKSLINAEREAKGYDEFSNIFGLGPRNQEPSSLDKNILEKPSISNHPAREKASNIDSISDQTLVALQGHPNKSIAAAAKAEADRRRHSSDMNRRDFLENRSYHTQFSKPIEEKAQKLRESIPRKESALNLSRMALENGDLSFFSLDKLADITGQDLFRTAKGAQLITAGKENLLSNMSRTSARAQNLWFEQRLNSMFPKIGQSLEANLTVQEMLEGELALDKLYQNTYDRLSSEDEDQFGFVKKDVDKRVHEEIKEQEKNIFNRTTYRLRELEEQEMGLEKLENKVGKNVTKGTPLTLAMAKLYRDKFGENALKVAQKNGYYIPTIEDYKMFRERPQEFREGLIE